MNDSGIISASSGILNLTDGGSGAPGSVDAATGGTVILGGTFSGTLTGSGSGSVVLANFTGAGANLNFTGSVLQWADEGNGGGLSGTITNAGAMTIATGTGNLELDGTLTNTGSIAVTGSNNIFAEATTSTIDNQSGGDIRFPGRLPTCPTTTAARARFNNAGTLEMTADSGTATIAIPVNDSGTISASSGILNLTDGGSGAPGSVDAATGGTVILGGTFSGTLTGSGSGSVVLANFTGAGATLNFTGSVLQWADEGNGGGLSGTVTNAGAMTIATGTGNVELDGTLTNTGSITVTSTNNIYAEAASSTIDNQSGATFNFQAATYMSDYNGGTGTFNNAGTLEMTAGSGTATIAIPVNDSGTISASSGILNLTDGGSGAPGSVDAATGGTVILGGTFSGTLTGSGAGSVVIANFTGTGATLNFTGSVLQWADEGNGGGLSGTVTNAGAMTIATGTGNVELDGTLTNTGLHRRDRHQQHLCRSRQLDDRQPVRGDLQFRGCHLHVQLQRRHGHFQQRRNPRNDRKRRHGHDLFPRQ